jgi:ribosomal protein L40E
MRSVRCDVCGTKALIAASQCPSCGHLFEMRDGSGEPLPLAHCSSCDAYYPAHVDSCKWCGTTLRPEKARKETVSPAKWIAVAAFIAAVWLGLVGRDPRPQLAARLRESAQSKPEVARSDAGDRVTAIAPVDTAPPVDPVVPTAVPQAAPQAAPQAPPPAKPRSATPWVSLVAKDWVIVRADAHGAAHIVASVGPNARVQLGESRGSWRRIRSRGIAGWVDVDRASFAAIRIDPPRAGRMVSR